jgi:hypothetical protein
MRARSRRTSTLLAAGLVGTLTLLAGCGSEPSADPAPSTRVLDSIVALGHSGTTGYNSDPDRPGVDTRENSWVTGTDPAVDSIYRRLLATHPALEGHATSLGVDASTVDALDAQVDAMLQLDPLPDVVVVQTLWNDLRCDGTDPANQQRFGRTLDRALTRIGEEDRYAQVFLVDQWGSALAHARAARDLHGFVAAATGTGPCDTYTEDGAIRRAGVVAMQHIVDGYFATVQRVCSAHPSCWTDDGTLGRMPVGPEDLTPDGNHLSVHGLATEAAYAWRALPDAIKNRP